MRTKDLSLDHFIIFDPLRFLIDLLVCVCVLLLLLL